MIVFRTTSALYRSSRKIHKTMEKKCNEGEKKTRYFDENNYKKHYEQVFKRHDKAIKKLLKR